MTYHSHVSIYDPNGVLLTKVIGDTKWKSKKRAYNESNKISHIYMKADKKVPIGSYAVKEALSEKQLRHKENDIFDFGEFEF